MNTTEKIKKIQNDLGINYKIMAKAMKIAPATYKNKKSEKSLGHSFNEKNLEDLKSFLKNYIKNL